MATDGLPASHVSSSSFSVQGDLSAEFCIYRRVQVYDGVTGEYAYSCVSSSNYSATSGITTVLLADEVVTADIVTAWFGVVGAGESSALPIEYIRTLVPLDLASLDSEGAPRGNKALNLQPGGEYGGRHEETRVASGESAIAIGYDTAATVNGDVVLGCQSESLSTDTHGAPNVVIGRGASTQKEGSVIIGPQARATETGVYAVIVGAYAEGGLESVALGYGANGGYHGISIGRGSDAGNSGLAMGRGATADQSTAVGSTAHSDNHGTAFGEQARARYKGVAIGMAANASYATYAQALGYGAKHEVAKSTNIAGAIITRNTSHAWKGDVFLENVGAEITVTSGIVDLTATNTVTVALPDGGTFFPNIVGVIVTAADGVTAQPSMQFGINGTDIETLIAETPTVGLEAPRDRYCFTSLLSADGVKGLAAKNSVPASATTLEARLYWQGLWVEDE
jgi:hypothetical protein